MMPEQETKVEVGIGGDGTSRKRITIRLSPVLTGARRDHAESVLMWLTMAEAYQLRDDLTRMLRGRLWEDES